jgi:hypothetical protein
MKSKLKILLAIAFVCTLLFVGNALAMSSANFRLDWFTPLTGGGGGPISSTNFKINYTLGQTAIGTSSSTNFKVGLGFWYGADVASNSIYLPLVLKNY